MSQLLEKAAKQFEEDLNLIGGEKAAMSEAEKYNLYAGLMNLARGMAQLERKIDLMRREQRSGEGLSE